MKVTLWIRVFRPGAHERGGRIAAANLGNRMSEESIAFEATMDAYYAMFGERRPTFWVGTSGGSRGKLTHDCPRLVCYMEAAVRLTSPVNSGGR